MQRLVREYYNYMLITTTTTKKKKPKEMDKFLETCNLPRLSQEEIENMNRTITNDKIESSIKL